MRQVLKFSLCKIVEIKIGGKTRFENLLKQLFHSPLLDMKCYYMALSHKDWELPKAKTDIDRGLDFPI